MLFIRQVLMCLICTTFLVSNAAAKDSYTSSCVCGVKLQKDLIPRRAGYYVPRSNKVYFEYSKKISKKKKKINTNKTFHKALEQEGYECKLHCSKFAKPYFEKFIKRNKKALNHQSQSFTQLRKERDEILEKLKNEHVSGNRSKLVVSLEKLLERSLVHNMNSRSMQRNIAEYQYKIQNDTGFSSIVELCRDKTTEGGHREDCAVYPGGSEGIE